MDPTRQARSFCYEALISWLPTLHLLVTCEGIKTTFQGLIIGFHHRGKDRDGTIPPLDFGHGIECKLASPGIGLHQVYPRLCWRKYRVANRIRVMCIIIVKCMSLPWPFHYLRHTCIKHNNYSLRSSLPCVLFSSKCSLLPHVLDYLLVDFLICPRVSFRSIQISRQIARKNWSD
jgi:hypothetical protein